jgi:ribonuclease E
VVRALRDYLAADIGEILIDDDQTYKEACEFVEQVMPHNLKKLKHYTESVPLFTRFQIESQIESAFTHSVNLPSGGSIVIDHTEALVSIDINSARATKGGDIEATALNTNLEAADEIARQLRIRDLGGLIVIDFIDMGPQKHQRDVENRLREAVRQDRARVQIGKISRFGLLEMSRQRLRPSLGESSYLTCPRCSGIGTIRSVESLALAILRLIGEEARKERTAKVIAQLPVEVATFLLNEKRDWVQNLESRNEMQVVLVANPALETPHYEVRRVRDDQVELPENTGPSYELADVAAEPETPQEILARKQIEPAAIAVMKPSKPAPERKKPEKIKKGLFAKLVSLFTSDDEQSDRKKSPSRRRSSTSKDSRSRGGQRSRQRPDSSRKTAKRGDQGRSDEKGAAKKTGKKKTAKKKTARKKAAKKKSTDAQTAKQQTAEQQSAQPQAAEQQKSDDRQPSRNRRSRGGRRRRRGGDRPPREQSTSAAEDGAQSQPETKQAEAPVKPPHKAEKPPEKPEQQAKPPEKTEKPPQKSAPQRESSESKPAKVPELLPAPDAASPKASKRAEPRADTDADKTPSSAQQAQPGQPAEPAPQKPEKPETKDKEKQDVKKTSSGNGVDSEKPPAKPELPPQPKPEGRLLPWDD